MLPTVSNALRCTECATVHGDGLEALGVANLLLGRQAEKDGLIDLLGLVLVGSQTLFWRLLLLLLDVLLHVRNERLGRALDLGRVQLVGSAICRLGGEWRLGGLVGLLGDSF